MKAKYKEDPRAWRKSTLLSVLALLMLSSLLFWRRILPGGIWALLCALLLVIGSAAWLRPQWFRGYYRFSTWAGFWSSQAVARLALALIFLLVITPAAVIVRLSGKDPLSLKRSSSAKTYWRSGGNCDSLDRLF